MEPLIRQAAKIIIESKMTLALTGAGISVESGIPDFRSPGGLWSIYDPAEYATITAFRSNPEKVWKMLREMDQLVSDARPNRAHMGLAMLEEIGKLHHIITQNVDNLHQAAGSKNVIEYHGNASSLTCLSCGNQYPAREKMDEFPPLCSCKKILKPDAIFFGESIPEDAMFKSIELASRTNALLVVGTSALVSPANTIPSISKKNGAYLIEINKEETHLTGSLTDVFLEGSAGEIMTDLVTEIKKAVNSQ